MKSKMIRYMRFPLLLLLAFLGWKYIFYLAPQDDTASCAVAKIEINGVVTGFGGHGSYQWIQIDNLERSIAPNFTDIKHTSGLDDSRVSFKIGDSVVKKRNSNALTIKRGAKYGVYIIGCD